MFQGLYGCMIMLIKGITQSLGYSVPISYGLVLEDLLVLKSEKPLKVLTSALLGYDLKEARYVFNQTVSKNYDSLSPRDDLIRIRERITPDNDAVGLLTAVDVRHTTVESMKNHELAVTALCTAGISNGSTAGFAPPEIFANYNPGTINLIIVIDGNLTCGALVNGLITTVEAKVRTLYEYGLRFKRDLILTGTTTDTVTILCTGYGRKTVYAGTGTEVGYFIGSTVYSALWQGLRKYFETKC